MKLFGMNLAVALAIAAVTTFAGAKPAMADSDATEGVHFYNDGWYFAHAEIWGYDANGNQAYYEASPSEGHGGNYWFTVPPGLARVYWQVRMDPFFGVIHQQNINGWYDFNEYCNGKHATIYVGGKADHPNHYDMHCSWW